MVAKFFRQALRGQTLEIYGDGAQTRDFIYIDDLIQAIWLCARADTGGEVFQIATYRETTVNEIAKAIKKLIELETNKEVNIVHTSPRAGDVRRNYSDISKAKKILGYDPQVELADGLEKTWRWFEACSEKP